MTRIIFSILIAIILTASCDKDKNCPEGSHKYIKLINNSTKTINWKPFNMDSIYYINGVPRDALISPYSTFNHGTRNDCWEVIFNGSNTLYLLFFDNDTVQAIGWEAISGTDRGLLKRVKVDIEYLNQNNFEIVYP